MKFTLQVETINYLEEALASNCDGVCFGSEFCEWKIPEFEVLKHAHKEVSEAGKTFSYVTPILSNEGIEKVRTNLDFLKNVGCAEVIIGDIGVLNLLQEDNGMKLRLGRPRVYIPARCPWDQVTRMPNPSFLTRLNVEKSFYQTNLNYLRTLEYYKRLGIEGADVDWIPKVFPNFKTIIKNGFNLVVHTHAVPVAITMKCHMARFLDEVEPALCTKPCLSNVLVIKQNDVKRDFTLHGNVVFRHAEPHKSEARELEKIGIKELVIPMSPVSGLISKKSVNDFITTLWDEV